MYAFFLFSVHVFKSLILNRLCCFEENIETGIQYLTWGDELRSWNICISLPVFDFTVSWLIIKESEFHHTTILWLNAHILHIHVFIYIVLSWISVLTVKKMTNTTCYKLIFLNQKSQVLFSTLLFVLYVKQSNQPCFSFTLS